MRAYIVPSGCTEIDGIRRVDRPEPQLRPGQVLIRVRATSLNYRDYAVVRGQYLGGAVGRDTIPLSDGAGEVVAVGPGVTRFVPGDRVAGVFAQTPPEGPPFAPRAALGVPLDGMLAEQVALYEDGLVTVPGGLSFEEAACLPCAAVTAWHALVHAGRPVRPGDTVLVLGTGGVSMFALQFARAAGAQVIVTSSSDAKLERATALGASGGINYTRTPAWEQEVLKLTGGRGVDCVVETGGAGTLDQSFQALAHDGKAVLIGVLTGQGGPINPYTLMPKHGSLHGIFVGGREMFEAMNRAITVNRIAPLIDRVFPFEEAAAAFRHHASRQFMGKIVVAIDRR
jgi:NADPH:quinone reductase-like Zn-dependent oxidoreductase